MANMSMVSKWREMSSVWRCPNSEANVHVPSAATWYALSPRMLQKGENEGERELETHMACKNAEKCVTIA